MSICQSKSSNLVRHNAVESFPAVWRGIKNIGGDSKTEDTISEKDHDGNQVGRGDSGVEDQHTILADKNFILGVLGLFDIKPTAEGHRVIAELLLKYGHREPAESICKRTLDFIPEDGSANSPLNEFKALVLMAQIQSKRGKKHSAREYVAQYDTPKYLTSEVIPPAVKQTALVTKARIEAKNNEIESACQAYIDAKLANPSKLTPGDILDEEISLFSDPKDVKFFFKTLKRWTSLERLTWLSWDFKDSGLERRDNLIDSAAKAGELDLIIDAYEEGIKYLDNVDAGAPLRCALSRVFSQGLQDLERAKRVLDEALDSGSTGWPYAVTDEHPDELLLEVMDSLTYIMYEMFRKSKDPIEKQKLLDEVVGLANRPLALDVPPISDTDLVCYRLWIAHMQLKMGPSITFQNRLTEQIKVCVAGLRDKVGWNDATNLSQLGRALYFLSTAIPACSEQAELRYVAGVLASARFSRLTKDDEDDGHENDSHSDGSEDGADSDDDESDDEEGAEEGNGNGEKNSDNSSEEPSQTPSDEGDLLKDAEWLCDGACRPNRSYDRWGKQVVFECYTCDYFLCEQCHTAVTKQEATPGRKFCGGDHEFVRLPVKGWGGVKDGKVMLEGYEDGGLAFDDLLTKVEGDLCRKAWDIFWEGV